MFVFFLIFVRLFDFKMKILGIRLIPVMLGTRTLKDAFDSAFLEDEAVELVWIEPAGKRLDTPDHAATLTRETKGAIPEFECYTLQEAQGSPLPVYAIAAGLDYPGVGPQHCYLKDIKRVGYKVIDDRTA